MLSKQNLHAKSGQLSSFPTDQLHDQTEVHTQEVTGSWLYCALILWKVGHWNELLSSALPSVPPSLSVLGAKARMAPHVSRHPGVHWQGKRAAHCSHTARSRARLAAGCFPSHCLHQLKVIIFNPNRKWFAHTTTASMQGRAFLLERSSTTRFKIEIEEKIWCITSGADIFVKRKQRMTLVNQKVCHSCKRGNTHFMLFCSSVSNQV